MFIREMMRLADMDALPAKPGALMNHMREWAERKLGDECPGDQTMRDWIKQCDWREHQEADHGNWPK
jgi:hypothetical protein